MKEKSKSGSPFGARASIGGGVVLLLVLVLNLAFGNPLFKLFWSGGVNAHARPAPARPALPVKDKREKVAFKGASKSTAKTQDEFARYDPALNLDELKNVLSRPAPKTDRNPFGLPPPPQPIQQVKQEPPPAPQPPPPPPPPPILLKAVGYSGEPGGIKEAYISDDQEVYVVHEGEEFGKRYKAIKMTPQQIEVEDQTGHQTVQLLVSQ